MSRTLHNSTPTRSLSSTAAVFDEMWSQPNVPSLTKNHLRNHVVRDGFPLVRRLNNQPCLAGLPEMDIDMFRFRVEGVECSLLTLGRLRWEPFPGTGRLYV